MYPIIYIGKFGIYIFPVIIVVALFFCVYCFQKNSRKYEFFDISQMFSLINFCLLFALLGGKLLYAVASRPASVAECLKSIVFGGFVFYGGVIGGIIGIAIYCKKKCWNFLDHADVLFTLIPGGQAIGRIGCFLNGCCYGKAYEGIFSVGYVVDGVRQEVFPTWFFEAVFCGMLFLLFQIVINTDRRGLQTGIYLVAYCTFRFVLEFMRGDEIRGRFWILSTSQWISLAGFAVGFYIINSSRIYRRNFLLKRRREVRWK